MFYLWYQVAIQMSIPRHDHSVRNWSGLARDAEFLSVVLLQEEAH